MLNNHANQIQKQLEKKTAQKEKRKKRMPISGKKVQELAKIIQKKSKK